jgi:hypothetical protein
VRETRARRAGPKDAHRRGVNETRSNRGRIGRFKYRRAWLQANYDFTRIELL